MHPMLVTELLGGENGNGDADNPMFQVTIPGISDFWATGRTRADALASAERQFPVWLENKLRLQSAVIERLQEELRLSGSAWFTAAENFMVAAQQKEPHEGVLGNPLTVGSAAWLRNNAAQCRMFAERQKKAAQ